MKLLPLFESAQFLFINFGLAQPDQLKISSPPQYRNDSGGFPLLPPSTEDRVANGLQTETGGMGCSSREERVAKSAGFNFPGMNRHSSGCRGPNPISDGAAICPEHPSPDFRFKGRVNGPEESSAQQSGIQLEFGNGNRLLRAETEWAEIQVGRDPGGPRSRWAEFQVGRDPGGPRSGWDEIQVGRDSADIRLVAALSEEWYLSAYQRALIKVRTARAPPRAEIRLGRDSDRWAEIRVGRDSVRWAEIRLGRDSVRWAKI
ncbi:hypothetical protein OUZ56_005275 [Daphnia magna]|uniref:Uncharacterized protein n=1 Tax=Daphnia magna TaxID=35525 RepID=A0ABQ9YSC2_9CRUS|nr:hypothetical protein OUZ56_005275 [Daphnia magna]